MSIEYKWTPVVGSVDVSVMSEGAIKALVDANIRRVIREYRILNGLPAEATAEELEAENYCHECGRPFEEEP